MKKARSLGLICLLFGIQSSALASDIPFLVKQAIIAGASSFISTGAASVPDDVTVVQNKLALGTSKFLGNAVSEGTLTQAQSDCINAKIINRFAQNATHVQSELGPVVFALVRAEGLALNLSSFMQDKTRLVAQPAEQRSVEAVYDYTASVASEVLGDSFAEQAGNLLAVSARLHTAARLIAEDCVK